MMITTLIQKDLTVLVRQRLVLIAAVTMVVLSACAACLSVQRTADFTAERLAAEASDQEVWESQGEKNPHGAAHVSRYAFKPVPGLAAFDPGSLDHAGLAVWMEAHRQNPAVFRRAEDGDDLHLLARLDPAWLLRVVAPLFLILVLHGALAGEREDGTFRQLMSSGVTRLQIGTSKLVAGLAALIVILLPAVATTLAVTALATGYAAPDELLRVGGLALTYLGYFTVIALVIVGVSALSPTRRTAFATLVVLWGASVVVAPRLAGDLAVALHPHPDAQTVRDQLSSASRAYFADPELQDADRRALLAEYGVDDVEALPISWSGYYLQRGEEVSHPLFEEIFREIDDRHAQQDRVTRRIALFSPTLAVRELSAGLAGTDRLHHRAFTVQAEAHRRRIIKALNRDLMLNGAQGGFQYKAGADLWEQIPPFADGPPSFPDLAPAYGGAAAILSAQLAAALLFAVLAIRIGVTRETTR